MVNQASREIAALDPGREEEVEQVTVAGPCKSKPVNKEVILGPGIYRRREHCEQEVVRVLAHPHVNRQT